VEVPTHRDFAQWNSAIQVISSSLRQLQVPLGKFLAIPHINGEWTTDPEGELLCRSMGDGSFALYEMDGSALLLHLFWPQVLIPAVLS
jgi:hypothetical protein